VILDVSERAIKLGERGRPEAAVDPKGRQASKQKPVKDKIQQYRTNEFAAEHTVRPAQ
jgi:hypothetical protein